MKWWLLFCLHPDTKFVPCSSTPEVDCQLICNQVPFGHREAHEAHMKGLDRIIAARGGVDQLGLDRLLKIMVSW